MADVKSIGIIFLVYFTIFANAGNTFCKDATKKLGDLETLVRNLDCGASQGPVSCDCCELAPSSCKEIYDKGG
ncbi:hypothetical protein OS493_038146 [Desmophyllum pertusum]|uniref:Uncharacterized protein n=1 Tax=Desmophyllum pertusum TaxID=174260 RepID=A0A9W9ZIF3_9CNID|nr:hypothetical protein OS493_038146 [Desmophyllum pertusum]